MRSGLNVGMDSPDRTLPPDEMTRAPLDPEGPASRAVVSRFACVCAGRRETQNALALPRFPIRENRDPKSAFMPLISRLCRRAESNYQAEPSGSHRRSTPDLFDSFNAMNHRVSREILDRARCLAFMEDVNRSEGGRGRRPAMTRARAVPGPDVRWSNQGGPP